jgi:hypothetical protein
VAKKKDSSMPVADFFAAQLEKRIAENGRDDTYMGDEGDKIIIGLPLQAFSLRYLFGNDVFPYSRMTELIGRSNSCKSAFLFEMYRWHIFNCTNKVPFYPEEIHGGYVHNLVEQRDSPDLRSSILQLGAKTNYPVVITREVEDWQKSCTDWIKHAESVFDDGLMPYPVAIGVDSLTAGTTRKEMEDTWKEGYANPGFSQIAKSINMWTKVYFSKMAPWPVSFIGVNHVKESKNNQGITERRVPGGEAIKYAATFLLRLNKREDIERLDEQGRVIEMFCEKNSLSSAGNTRMIKVHIKWSYDDDGNQLTCWDWHSASVELLASFEATRKKRISEFVQIENLDRTHRTADCSTLGLKKTSWSEIGQAIMQEPEIVKGLDKLFGIRNRRVFELGVPFKEQKERAKAEVTEDGEIIS